jgi:hypothetical protein
MHDIQDFFFFQCKAIQILQQQQDQVDLKRYNFFCVKTFKFVNKYTREAFAEETLHHRTSHSYL